MQKSSRTRTRTSSLSAGSRGATPCSRRCTADTPQTKSSTPASCSRMADSSRWYAPLVRAVVPLACSRRASAGGLYPRVSDRDRGRAARVARVHEHAGRQRVPHPSALLHAPAGDAVGQGTAVPAFAKGALARRRAASVSLLLLRSPSLPLFGIPPFGCCLTLVGSSCCLFAAAATHTWTVRSDDRWRTR